VAWYDNENEYYQDAAGALRQGELVLAPTVVVELGEDMAMVIPHDCALEKEFNERVGELVRNGTSEEVAIAQASTDSTLDRLVAVAQRAPTTLDRNFFSPESTPCLSYRSGIGLSEGSTGSTLVLARFDAHRRNLNSTRKNHR